MMMSLAMFWNSSCPEHFRSCWSTERQTFPLYTDIVMPFFFSVHYIHCSLPQVCLWIEVDIILGYDTVSGCHLGKIRPCFWAILAEPAGNAFDSCMKIKFECGFLVMCRRNVPIQASLWTSYLVSVPLVRNRPWMKTSVTIMLKQCQPILHVSYKHLVLCFHHGEALVWF